jgi:hypothetical protein
MQPINTEPIRWGPEDIQGHWDWDEKLQQRNEELEVIQAARAETHNPLQYLNLCVQSLHKRFKIRQAEKWVERRANIPPLHKQHIHFRMPSAEASMPFPSDKQMTSQEIVDFIAEKPKKP